MLLNIRLKHFYSKSTEEQNEWKLRTMKIIQDYNGVGCLIFKRDKFQAFFIIQKPNKEKEIALKSLSKDMNVSQQVISKYKDYSSLKDVDYSTEYSWRFDQIM